MKKYTEIIKENKENLNEHDGILIIVDVQKVFGKFIPRDFEKKLNIYASKFDKVYQIWDSNKINKPSYKFNNEIKNIRKNYGTKFSKDLVKLTDELELNHPNVKEGDIFKTGNNFVIKIDNNHKWFYLNDELVELYNELKGKNVIIVGGADNECLEDVFVSMNSFGINAIYNHDYIYSAETSNQQQSTLQ
jgi:hypothetical protein